MKPLYCTFIFSIIVSCSNQSNTSNSSSSKSSGGTVSNEECEDKDNKFKDESFPDWMWIHVMFPD